MDTRIVHFKSLFTILGVIVFGLLQLCASLQCGIHRIRHEPLIETISSTGEGEWPWHAAIYHHMNQSEKYACGGTLISDQFVLTAAHCTVNRNTGIKLPRRELFIRLGVYNLDEIDPSRMQQYPVEDVYTAGNFKIENMRDDIALLKLEGSVQITDYVVPACINRQPNMTKYVGMSVGWRVLENEEISPVLKSAIMSVYYDDICMIVCHDFFEEMCPDGIFCAGFIDESLVYEGYAGGGLFFKHGGAWYVEGIVSFSKLIEDDSSHITIQGYTVLTKVGKYLSWISNITGIDLAVGDV